MATLPYSLIFGVGVSGDGVPDEVDSESIVPLFFGVSGTSEGGIAVTSSLTCTCVAGGEGDLRLALENPITNQKPTNPVCSNVNER